MFSDTVIVTREATHYTSKPSSFIFSLRADNLEVVE